MKVTIYTFSGNDLDGPFCYLYATAEERDAEMLKAIKDNWPGADDTEGDDSGSWRLEDYPDLDKAAARLDDWMSDDPYRYERENKVFDVPLPALTIVVSDGALQSVQCADSSLHGEGVTLVDFDCLDAETHVIEDGEHRAALVTTFAIEAATIKLPEE